MNIYPMEERRIGIKSCSLSEIFLKWEVKFSSYLKSEEPKLHWLITGKASCAQLQYARIALIMCRY